MIVNNEMIRTTSEEEVHTGWVHLHRFHQQQQAAVWFHYRMYAHISLWGGHSRHKMAHLGAYAQGINLDVEANFSSQAAKLNTCWLSEAANASRNLNKLNFTEVPPSLSEEQRAVLPPAGLDFKRGQEKKKQACDPNLRWRHVFCY